MALAETANLIVKLSLKDQFSRELAKSSGRLSKFNAQLQTTETRAYRAGQQIGTGIRRGLGIAAAGFAVLAGNVAIGLHSRVELEKATAQTEAVIKSTGGVAGVTAEEVRRLAEEYEALNATIGDETIQAGENLLLTFTAVRKEAFEPALEAALNMSTALGQDLTASVKTVGKALSDPAKAAGKLARQGIVLTKSEQKLIKKFTEANDTLGAQQVILDALEERYGGSFAKAGDTVAGKVAKFNDSIEDLQRALAETLLPAVGNIADALSELLRDPQTIRDVKEMSQAIGEMFSPANIRKGIGALKEGVGFLRSVAGPIADVIGGAVKAFTSLPPDIQKLLVGGFAVNKLTGGLVTNIAGGIFGALKAMTVQAGVVNVTGGVVNGGGGGVPGVGAGGAAGGAAMIFPLAAIGALMVGAAGIVAEPVRKLTGVTAGGLGTVKAEVGGLKVVMGQSQAAVAHAVKEQASTTEQKLAQLKDQADRTKDDTVSAQTKTTRAAQETKREASRGVTQTRASASATQGTIRGTASAIQGTIRANRPIITVNVSVTGNAVTKSQTKQSRYGSGGESRYKDRARPD